MKKLILSLSLVLFIALNSFSQTEGFSTGWYIVKSGATTGVIKGNSADVSNKVDWKKIGYSVNEVLLAFDFSKDIYYCYDPDGRVVLVKGKASLQKITVPGRPGNITEDVKLGLDLTLHNGNNVWLTDFNAAAKTATILLVDGNKVDIPQTSIRDNKDYFDSLTQDANWRITK